MRKNIPSDLLIVLIWTVMAFIFVIAPILQNSIIRTILGVPMVLFIPGYVLIAAFFPRKDDLDSIERIALSFGLSIATVPLIGLLLNFTPFGIRLIPILVTLSIYVVAMTIVAIYRREKLPVDLRFEVPFYKIYDSIKAETHNSNRTDKILTGVLILSIILAIGTLIYVITVPKVGEKFTEFYILGPDGKADNYPTSLKSDVVSNITVGIVNHEYSSANYTLQIDLDKSILTSKELILGNNETWERNVTFLPNKMGADMKLEFLLFKENNLSVPYRDLHLWVNVT
jgi:uncharacterized membrane protein